MINPKIPGKVTCKGRPNPKIAQMLDDWLFDCRMAREAQANQIAQDTSAVSDSVEVHAGEKVMS